MPHALVTGGARGIGQAIALALIEAGYTVTATGLTQAEIEAAEKVDGLDLRVLDVTDPHAVARLVGDLDRLDALVNCAGMVMRGGVEYELENFEKVIAVNLTGTMRMCAAAKPLLARQGGAIVNTASMLSYFGGPLVPGYTASKGGVAQLTKSLAAHWAPDGIRVNAIAPGWVETELTRALVEDPARSQGVLSRTPMARWAKPADIAGAALFLLSPQASFVTGTVLPVDGGYSAV
jgi:NAD(P)-dependent dehydrogenase (short-subunit alcohol dehydrogenase family)